MKKIIKVEVKRTVVSVFTKEIEVDLNENDLKNINKKDVDYFELSIDIDEVISKVTSEEDEYWEGSDDEEIQSITIV